MSNKTPSLILASSSPFRQSLLKKLGIPFSAHSPEIDESPLANESAEELVQRLAKEKAKEVAKSHSNALIIGSDQVAIDSHGNILGKPGNYDNAKKQLLACSGTTVTFATGLCLYNSATHKAQVACETFTVHFRELNDTMIDRYLRTEEPYQSAGSFKSEGLGIVLFNRLEGRDPNGLVGLPLILLTDFLANEGIQLPLEP